MNDPIQLYLREEYSEAERKLTKTGIESYFLKSITDGRKLKINPQKCLIINIIDLYSDGLLSYSNFLKIMKTLTQSSNDEIRYVSTIIVKSLMDREIILKEFKKILSMDKRYVIIADIYNMMGYYNVALELYKQAIEFFKNLNQDNIEIYNKILKIYGSIGNIKEYKSILDKIKDKIDLITVEMHRATLLRLECKYNEALEKYKKLLIEINNFSNKNKKLLIKIGDIYYYMGLIYWKMRNYKKSKIYYNKAFNVFKEIRRRFGVAMVYNGLALIYWRKGLYDKSIDLYKKSLTLYKIIRHDHGVARVYNNLALVYWKCGKYDQALNFYRKALRKDKELGDIYGVSIVCNNMGLIYYNLNMFERALKYYRRSLKICERLNDKYGIAVVCGNIGLVYREIGEYNKALKYFNRAIKVNEEIKDIYGLAINYRNIGSVYLRMNDYDKAQSAFIKSLKLFEKTGDPDEILETLLYLAKSTKEEKYYDDAITVFSRWRRTLRTFTSKYLSELYNIKDAVELFINKDIKKAYKVHLMIKNRTAVDIFGVEFIDDEKLNEEISRLLSRIEYLRNLLSRTYSEEILEEIRKTEELYRQKIEEATERAFGNRAKIFDVKGHPKVIDLYIGNGKVGYFYDYNFKAIDIKPIAELIEILSEEDMSILEMALTWRYNMYYKYQERYGRTIKPEIRGDTLILIYEKTPVRKVKLNTPYNILRHAYDCLMACITHPCHLEYRTKYNIKENRYLNYEEYRERKMLSKKLNETALRILEAFGESFSFLFEFDEAIISPASPLLNFPFHVIKQDRFLFEEVNVKIVPHADVVNIITKQRDHGEPYDVLIYLSKLPQAKKEVENISRYLSNPVILRDPCVKDLLKFKGARLYHFAVHGYADISNAIFSYIELKDRLHLKDIIKLRPADLVCLSACETGVHEDRQDSLNMPTAFFCSGAKRVIATLWKVWDYSSRLYFESFYDLLNSEDVYQAYKKSMINLRKSFEELFFWSPFCYYGI